MKFKIIKDEWWPVFELYEGKGSFEFTEEEMADYKRVEAEFDAWQDKLSSLYYRRSK